ncbi:MAG: c-type cytochrome [Xanthomonadales bacterium]|nr:c-type cytochrome [Xanthomonadales bacterium]
MKKLLKWCGIALGGVLVLGLLAVLAVFGITEWQLSRTFEVAATPIAVPEDPAALKEGRRLAALRGCNGGCHGPEGAGRVFFEVPDGSRVIAANLSQVADDYSDAELARVIRHGVRPDGTSVFGAMPSEMFNGLTDGDTARIIAWMRSLPAGNTELPETRFGPMLRGMMLYFQREGFEPLAAAGIEHDAGPLPRGDDPVARGRYLALTVCTECHGSDLAGMSVGLAAPSLEIAKAYSPEAFDKLMIEGLALGDREVGIMSSVSRGRFAHFTAQERADLFAFLQAR